MGITKFIMTLTAIASLVFGLGLIAGCDDSSDSKDGGSGNNNLIEKEGVIVYASEATGYDRMFEMGNINLLINSTTALQKQRPSCSGFDYCGAYDFGDGNFVEYGYYQDDVDYTTKPERVVPVYVRVYRDECLHPTNDIPSEPCNDCDDNPCNDCD